MSHLARHSTATHANAGATVHETRSAVMTMARALEAVRPAGPSEAYHVMGSLSLMIGTVQGSMCRLATWLRAEEHLGRLAVVEGPFVDDPEAAVQVAAQSLHQASRACREALEALERAHIAMAHVATRQSEEPGPS